MKIVSVIPLKKGILKEDLTYFTSLSVTPGDAVYVPLRGKKTLALVTDAEELKDSKTDVKGMDFNLKKVSENLGPSVFKKEYLETIFSASRYFAQNKNRAITSLIPNVFIENYDKISKLGEKNKEQEESNDAQKILDEKLILQYPLHDRISIYKTLVRESFARNKSLFMVLPTEADIGKFSRELSKGIEQFTFSLHSGINAKKNLAAYESIMSSAHPVFIIATAPFLSIPRADIGTIILEHENSNSYRMIKQPYFDLRTFAEIYASKMNIKFVLAGEILRFETIGRIDTDHLHPMYPLSYRLDFNGEIEIENRKKDKLALEASDNRFRIFGPGSVAAIKQALEEKKNIFIFSLRKGLATMTVCRDCGDSVSCPRCGAPLVLYLSHQGKKRMFVCNRCAEEIDGDVACATCGGWNLMPLGIGTDTVYEEVKELTEGYLPKVKIFQLDKETAKTSAGAKKIAKEFEENSGAILIGTEMAFFYLRKRVPFSIIASFDSLWSIPNYKMSEKIIQIASGMAGHTIEKFIIQTKNENDPAIAAIKSGNLLSFVREELSDRKKLNYPPYKRFIKITHLGDKEQTARARALLAEIFAEYTPEIFSGFISRLKGKYLTNALLKLEPEDWSLPELSLSSKIDTVLQQKLLSLGSNFEIFIDPEDLL